VGELKKACKRRDSQIDCPREKEGGGARKSSVIAGRAGPRRSFKRGFAQGLIESEVGFRTWGNGKPEPGGLPKNWTVEKCLAQRCKSMAGKTNSKTNGRDSCRGVYRRVQNLRDSSSGGGSDSARWTELWESLRGGGGRAPWVRQKRFGAPGKTNDLKAASTDGEQDTGPYHGKDKTRLHLENGNANT